MNVFDGFWEKATEFPDVPALRDTDRNLKYGELAKLITEYSSFLRKLPHNNDYTVGVYANRSIESLVAVLSIIASNFTCVPLDSSYPDDRLKYIANAACLNLILCDAQSLSKAREIFPSSNCLDLTKIETSITSNTHSTPDTYLAYILFTSGSTGTPKGVAMGHEPLINLMNWHKDYDDVRNERRTAQLAPMSFDVFFQEVFSTLLTGGTLCLCSDQARLNSETLGNLINSYGIERLFLPPQLLSLLISRNDKIPFASLRNIYCAGDKLVLNNKIKSWFKLNSLCKLHNHYGPTETHVVTSYTFSDSPKNWPVIPPIGKPISGVDYIIEPTPEYESLFADQKPGELLLGGICLAKGYYKRNDLTAQKFISTLGKVYYKTGDLVYIDHKGNINFIDRIDGMVKIRGYRVELGEVENALSLSGLKDCVVISHSFAEKESQLLAYYPRDNPSENDEINILEVRGSDCIWADQLRKILPEYMIPAKFIALNRLPMTPSGKVARKNLPIPVPRKRPSLVNAYIPPESDIHKQIHFIWAEELEVENIGIDDSLFDLGGTSLIAAKIYGRLSDELGFHIKITDIFNMPTIRLLAEHISGRAASDDDISSKKRRIATIENSQILAIKRREAHNKE